MARLYVATNCIQKIEVEHPDTDLTLCGLRRLVRQGAIPTVNIGRKKLINYDQLLDYLNSPTLEQIQTQQGQVRRVS